MNFLIILILFFLPVFPLSMLINKFLNTLKTKYLVLCMLIFFIVGSLLLTNIDTKSFSLQLAAIFTVLFYSFRLLSVKNLRVFVLYFYPIFSAFILFWQQIGGDITKFAVIFIPIFALFLSLFFFISNRFGVVHEKSIRGLGALMPRFSILFIISIMVISSSLLFFGYEMLVIKISKLSIFYGIILSISWMFINWSSIKLIEWMIYGLPYKNIVYEDLNISQMTTIIILLVIDIGCFIFYNLKGLI